MLAVSAVLSDEHVERPPLLLVHGSANSAAVWTFWQRELAAHGWSSYAIDLRGHGKSGPTSLSETTMDDYTNDVDALLRQLRERPVVMGWSMGGLVAMMVAAKGRARACIAVAPSLPARTINSSVELRTGEFGPEEYGITDPTTDDQPAFWDLDPEERRIGLASLGRDSRRARDQRRRGIVIEALPYPLLLITGSRDTQYPAQRYDDLWLPVDRMSMEGASHWGLVLNRRGIASVLPHLLGWLEKHV